MILSAWVANTLDEVVKTCIMLLDKGVNDIDIVLKDEDRTENQRYLSVVVRRNDEEEGQDESA